MMKPIILAFLCFCLSFACISQNADTSNIIKPDTIDYRHKNYFIFVSDYIKIETNWNHVIENAYQKNCFTVNLKDNTIRHLVKHYANDYTILSKEFNKNCLTIHAEKRINKKYVFYRYFFEGKIIKIERIDPTDIKYTYTYNKI